MSKIVLKCPRCGTVQYVKGDGPCWKCRTMVVFPKDGIIQIYRMASCGGMFGRSMEIYINGILFGYVGFNEAISIPVPYGNHHVMAKFMDYKLSKYKGIGLEVDVTPQNRFVYLKAARIVPGYSPTVVLDPATAEEMPPV